MESFKKAMKDSESAMETGGYSYKKVIDGVIKDSDCRPCNEKNDIRDTGIKSEPFAPSGNRNVKSETRSSNNEYGYAKKSDELICDTTRPAETNIHGIYDDPWTVSGKKVIDRIIKRSDALGASGSGNNLSKGTIAKRKEKTFNS